ncbi:MAG: M15 family metallopeptidase [Dehalococcoidia bacterium]
MNKKLEDLRPAVRDAALRATKAMDDKGVLYAIFETLRSTETQIAYYAQGRLALDTVNDLRIKAGLKPIGNSENMRKITNCDGIKILSQHQSGSALDIVPMTSQGYPCWPGKQDGRWRAIAEAMKAEGFEWGGDWTSFPDFPHFEMKGVQA